MVGACHTHFKQNQRVRVMFKDKNRRHYIGRFKARRSKFIEVGKDSFPLADVRAVVIER